MFLMLLGYGILIFCNSRIYKLISEHITSTALLRSTRTAAENANERSILKATILKVIPIIFAMPSVFFLISVFVDGWEDSFSFVLIKIGPFRPTLADIGFGCFMFVPTCNALVTLLVVKTYRTASFNIFFGTGGLFVRKAKVATTSGDIGSGQLGRNGN